MYSRGAIAGIDAAWKENPYPIDSYDIGGDPPRILASPWFFDLRMRDRGVIRRREFTVARSSIPRYAYRVISVEPGPNQTYSKNGTSNGPMRTNGRCVTGDPLRLTQITEQLQRPWTAFELNCRLSAAPSSAGKRGRACESYWPLVVDTLYKLSRFILDSLEANG